MILMSSNKPVKRLATYHNYRFIIFSILCLFCIFGKIQAQTVNVIPYPQSVVKSDGQFALNNNSLIGMNDFSLQPQVNYLQSQLKKSANLNIAVDQDENKATVDLQLIHKTQPEGSYTLAITSQKIIITASDNAGIFYGLVSLVQLVKSQPSGSVINLATMTINDTPRYQWRGFMLDESRHFFGKEKVKQLLDWMAFYKLNRFHWHLTDANGWRLEIKKYPLLTSVGGVGNYTDTLAPAKFYTQDEIKEIVSYAQDRFITVIPEIDMPGHATAANRAYPEFSGGSINRYPNFTFDPANEKVYPFLADIIKEAESLFPSKMIHLGGDEVALGMQAWAGRPAISEMLAKNKFTSLADLEHYFFRRMADTVTSLGSKVLCWDEAAETDLPADKTIIFWWRQNMPYSLQLALQKKYQVVLCPRLPLYFDFLQDKNNVSGRRWIGSYNSESDVYNFPDKQLPASQIQPGQILGIQANLWTETVGSEKRLDYMIFPRMAALAEAAWTNEASKDEVSFNERLKTNLALYDKDGIYYYNVFDPAAHPEAIDFAPKIAKPVERKSRRYHERGKKNHHHHKDGKSEKHASKQHRAKPKKRK